MSQRIGYLELPVSDLPEAVSFYEKVCGPDKLFESPTHVIFDGGGVEFALVPGGRKGDKESAPGIFFLVGAVDEEYRALQGRRIAFNGEPTDERWGGRIVGFTDPDGNRLGLYRWRER